MPETFEGVYSKTIPEDLSKSNINPHLYII